MFSTGSRRLVKPSRTGVPPQSSLAMQLGQLIMCRMLTIQGKATPRGTKRFMERANLPMFHCFDKTSLYVSPIIHGAPRSYTLEETDYFEALMKRAVLRNKSNCVVVYNHEMTGTRSKTWHATGLDKLLTPPPLHEEDLTPDSPVEWLNRDEIVAVANLGLATTGKNIRQRLANACALTGLEQLDMAMIEIDEDVLDNAGHHVSDSLHCLEELCQQGILQSYGVRISVAPYCYHSPPLRNVGPLSMIPSSIEDYLKKDLKFADLVVYPLSPTIAIPSTWPMLDPDPDIYDQEAAGISSGEMTRRFTRAASDPLICYAGLGKPSDGADERETELEMMREVEIALDEQLPGAEDGGECDSDEDKDEAEKKMQGKHYTGDSVEALDKNDQLKNKIKREGEASSEKVSETAGEVRTGQEWVLMNGLIPPPIDGVVGQALDSLCPALSTSKELHEKALRLVFSVGMDAVILDAELSSMMGPLSLRPEDMLASSSTDDVWGNFMVPADDE